MCVHGTIGAVTALVETGRLRPRRGRLLVDTPERPLPVRLRRRAGRVSAVTLLGTPARVVDVGLTARVCGREVAYDLAFAGNLVALIEAAHLGIDLEPAEAARLIEAGTAVKHAAQAVSPEVVACVVYERRAPGRYRDFVAFRDGTCDRSPCGSCFAALMGLLHERGRLAPGEWTECENVLGLGFRGRLLRERGALVPELVGRAFVTGEHRFRIDSRDPLRHGFVL
jgi:proline racemase